MAYDEGLAQRIRDVLAGEPGLTEMKMFGGLGFLINGNMACGAGSKGQMILRADSSRTSEYVGEHIRPMEMRGKPMGGWLEVDSEEIATDADLERVVEIGAGYARSLPPKVKKK